MSLHPPGFHLPVDAYMVPVLKVLTPGDHVVLDIRKNVTKDTDGYRTCDEAFDTVEVVKDADTFRGRLLPAPIHTGDSERTPRNHTANRRLMAVKQKTVTTEIAPGRKSDPTFPIM